MKREKKILFFFSFQINDPAYDVPSSAYVAAELVNLKEKFPHSFLKKKKRKWLLNKYQVEMGVANGSVAALSLVNYGSIYSSL